MLKNSVFMLGRFPPKISDSSPKIVNDYIIKF